MFEFKKINWAYILVIFVVSALAVVAVNYLTVSETETIDEEDGSFAVTKKKLSFLSDYGNTAEG